MCKISAGVWMLMDKLNVAKWFRAKSPSLAICKEGDLTLLNFSNLTCMVKLYSDDSHTVISASELLDQTWLSIARRNSWRPPHLSASYSIEEQTTQYTSLVRVLFLLKDQQVTVFTNQNHDLWPFILRRNNFWTVQRRWTFCFHTVF